jgi:M6 family metalloprotease-like protein
MCIVLIILSVPSVTADSSNVTANDAPFYPLEPVLGLQKFMAVRVSFPDRNFTADQETLLERIGLLGDYFFNVSYGHVSINVTFVRETCQLNKNSTYYSDSSLEGPKQMELVNDSLLLAGIMTNLTGFTRFILFCAGDDITIHPNATGFRPFAYFTPQVFGYRSAPIVGYACVVTESSPLGVLAHEVGHTFGLPDLYNASIWDRGYEADNLVGAWFLMGTGSLNPGGLGTIPAHPSAWEKIHLGWIDSSQVVCRLSGTQVVVRLNSTESGVGVIVLKIGSGATYLLAEFKKRTGYDSGLPYEGGLVLYRVNESEVTGRGIIKVVDGVHGWYDSGFTLRIPDDRVFFPRETIFTDASLNVSIIPLKKYNNTIVLLVGSEYIGLVAENTSRALVEAIKFRDDLRLDISEKTGMMVRLNETDAVIEEGWKKYSEANFSEALRLAYRAWGVAKGEQVRFLLWIHINGFIILAILLVVSSAVALVVAESLRFIYMKVKRFVEARFHPIWPPVTI